MAQFYKVLKADPLGEPWTPNQPNAKPIQNYWCQVEGMDESVSIGRQVDNPLTPGVHVYGDLNYAKSQKGTVYFKFKGVKVPDGVQRPVDAPSTPAQATAQQSVGTGQSNMSAEIPDWFKPYANMIGYIYREMRNVDGSGQPEAVQTTPMSSTDAIMTAETGVEHVGGEPVSPETKEMLDDIFNSDPEV